jgi:hypothetical protein
MWLLLPDLNFAHQRGVCGVGELASPGDDKPRKLRVVTTATAEQHSDTTIPASSAILSAVLRPPWAFKFDAVCYVAFSAGFRKHGLTTEMACGP